MVTFCLSNFNAKTTPGHPEEVFCEIGVPKGISVGAGWQIIICLMAKTYISVTGHISVGPLQKA